MAKLTDYEASLLWDEYSLNGYSYISELPESRKMLKRIAGLIGRNKQVLDAGCGTGILSEMLSEKNRVVAVDFSRRMLDFASQKAKCKKSMEVRYGNINSLQFNSCCFDAVVCVNALFTLEDPEKAVLEFRRVLKSGGILILSSPLKGIGSSVFNKVKEDARIHGLDMGKINSLIDQSQLMFQMGQVRYTPSYKGIISLVEGAGFRVEVKERTYYNSNFLIMAVSDKSERNDHRG
ncbi:class I SAM-dependent methyltransferase [Candidatus Woesearchaeota archaeon]|nr:class I SAM-dependent methyltransferase [Candidatus Woesearchaeota archaeon]